MQNSHNYSFDVLRFISVSGVFLYHLYPSQFPLSYLGVLGFFVLAGYLSMRKVIIASESGGLRKRLGASLGDKFLKLYPPLCILLIPLSICMVVSFPQFLDNYQKQLQSALLGFNNIQQILAGDSYFEGQAYLKPLTHLWALSLEMQFYLLFSLTVERFYRRGQKKFWALQFFLLGTYSILSLLLFFQPEDPTRIYYGTDSRLFSFIFGLLAALALEGPARRSKRMSWPRLKAVLASILTPVLAIAYLLPCPLGKGLQYGLVVYSFLYALDLVFLAHDPCIMRKIGQSLPVAWLCSRSYEIYLWHYPVFLLCERYLANKAIQPALFIALEVFLALLLAEAAWQIRRLLKKIFCVHENSDKKRQNKPTKNYYLRICLNLLLVLALIFLPWQKIYEAKGENFRQLEESIAKAEESLSAQREQRQSPTKMPRPEVSPTATHHDSGQSTIKKPPNKAKATIFPEDKGAAIKDLRYKIRIAEATEPNWDDWIFAQTWEYMDYFNTLAEPFHFDKDVYLKCRDLKFAMIGDSVSVINSYHIFYYWPELALDALSNRQMHEVWEIYQGLKAEDAIGELLVVALGSNGDIAPAELEKVWQDLDGKPLILVNIVLPYNLTETERNGDIDKFCQEHENVYLVDWHAQAKTIAEYFQEDYIHPSDLGCKAYCHLLTAKILDVLALYEQADLLEFYAD